MYSPPGRPEKRLDSAGTVTMYDYFGNFVYKNDVLQYITNEEGRARPIANDCTGNQTRFVYDYFVKDHLGNARLEGGDPDSRVGTAIMLQVMPGDKFEISTDSYYEGENQTGEESGAAPLVGSLMTALMGGGTYAGTPISELPENMKIISGLLTDGALPEFLQDIQLNDNPLAPKAHLNYLFFDNKLQLVPSLSGSIQVQGGGTTGWQNSGSVTIGPSAVGNNVIQPAYVIIYVDNQTIGKNVWFDNVHVEHYTSKLLEEDHYYPFGLTVGVTHTAQNNLPAQPYKYQGKKLEKSFGLEMYDFQARMLDAQLGRTWQPDPHAHLYPTISPYASMNNSPPNYIDPNGKDVRIGMQKDYKGNKTITLSSTIYVKGYNQKEKTAEYNQFLKDNAGMLSNTTKNEDGTSTTVNIEMQYVEATDQDVARVTNEETRNGDNLMLIGNDEGRSSASFLDKKVTNPVTGEVTTEKFTAYSARLGGKSEHYSSSKTAFHESMHLFGLRDWYKTAEDRYKVGFHDMMNNHTSTNTKPVMHQIHWNNWGKAAKEQQQQSGTNNFILNRPVETE